MRLVEQGINPSQDGHRRPKLCDRRGPADGSSLAGAEDLPIAIAGHPTIGIVAHTFPVRNTWQDMTSWQLAARRSGVGDWASNRARW